MARRPQPELWIVRVVRGHVRLWFAVALGFVVYAVTPDAWRTVTRLLLSWDIAVAAYLALTAAMMARSPVADIRKHSATQDEGAFALMVLTVAAAMTSLATIFFHLSAPADEPIGASGYVLAIATVVLSWTFIHTIFAVHYAHDFYGSGKRANGLKFPGDDKPDYWDFVYFSFVIGMTFQVSDVAVTNKWIRRSVVAHGALSFAFTTTIIALAVNMAANAI